MSKRLYSQTTFDEQEDSRAAIPLSKSTPDLVNGIPLSGEDYLLVVRQQARKCAKTVVAERPKETKKVNLPAHFQFFNNDDSNDQNQASETWRRGFTKVFKSYQKHMQKNKGTQKMHKEVKDIDQGRELLYKEGADLKKLLPSLSQHTILNLLRFHIQWLSKHEDINGQCMRVFGLLAFLDPVLTSANISILRDLSRECMKLRKSTPEQHIPLNIIITIISGTFRQADLL